MCASKTITEAKERLENPHPGDVLREDFLVGSDLSVEEVARGSGISTDLLDALLACKSPVDAETGLRLSRYFGMNESFFLGLQMDFDLEEVLRTRGKELDAIKGHAA